MIIFRRNTNNNNEIVEGLKNHMIRIEKVCLSELSFEDMPKIDEIEKIQKDIIKYNRASDFEQEFGTSFEDLIFLYKYLDFIRVLLLFINGLSYLLFTDIKTLIKDEDFEKMLNNAVFDLPDWPEVYKNLVILPPFIIRFYIAQMNCNNETKTILSNALIDHNYNLFYQLISQMGENSYFLKKVADIYKLCLNFYDEHPIVLDLNQEDLLPPQVTNLLRVFSQKASSTEKNVFEIYNYANMREFCAFNMDNYIQSRKIYLINRDNYSKEIQEIMDPYNVDPVQIPFYHELIKRGYVPNDLDNNVTDEMSFDDLVIFNGASGPVSEHFNGLAPQIIELGDETFKEFVNYLAYSDYIENTSAAKQLFTYRITGKCRPKQTKLPKLVWNGKEKRSDKELLYIIKYATDNSKDKYKKMMEFFDGPDFHQDNASSFADGASLVFRKQLHDFYDRVFSIKETSTYRYK